MDVRACRATIPRSATCINDSIRWRLGGGPSLARLRYAGLSSPRQKGGARVPGISQTLGRVYLCGAGDQSISQLGPSFHKQVSPLVDTVLDLPTAKTCQGTALRGPLPEQHIAQNQCGHLRGRLPWKNSQETIDARSLPIPCSPVVTHEACSTVAEPCSDDTTGTQCARLTTVPHGTGVRTH